MGTLRDRLTALLGDLDRHLADPDAGAVWPDSHYALEAVTERLREVVAAREGTASAHPTMLWTFQPGDRWANVRAELWPDGRVYVTAEAGEYGVARFAFTLAGDRAAIAGAMEDLVRALAALPAEYTRPEPETPEGGRS